MRDVLIRRKAVIEAVDRHTRDDGTLDEDISIILEEVKTAFDKEKTIKELKQNRDITEAEYKVAGEYGDDGNFLMGKVMAYDIAMAIVEKGGIE